MTITSEGLRIELLESATNTFFDSGKPEPNRDGQDILLAWPRNSARSRIKSRSKGTPIPNRTRAKGYYSNWELSVDRANAARRIMQQNGIRVDQIMQVRGFADQHLP